MLEDRRNHSDQDARRDAERRMCWFSLFGMLLFPLRRSFTEWMELPQASVMLSSMSNIYYVLIAAIVTSCGLTVLQTWGVRTVDRQID